MTGIGDRSCRRYLAKNEETLELLIRAYSDALVRYAYCYVGSAAVAEDMMEEAFVAYLVKKVEFETKEQIRAWLYKTVRSRCVDYLRRHKREVPLEDVHSVLHTQNMEQDLMKRQRNEGIYIAMQNLPRQYRAVLQLHYFDEFEIQHICKILGKTPKQVYNLLSRAKVALKDLIVKEGITHEDLS